jgi:UDP-GlcNAc:undecaprenyl-phosphate GlcNAc-1-phosphate transferase
MLDAVKSLSVGNRAGLAWLVALLVALAITPLVRRLAWRANAVARPDARRLHPEPIAQWGGLAIFVAVAFAALLWRQPTLQDIRLLAPSGSASDVSATAQTLHLSTFFFGCGALMLMLGMLDDRFELSPLWKFGGQIVIAYALWRGGFRINTLPFSSGTQVLEDWQSLGITLFWILGLTNGVNLIDGVDGLAAGVCAIGAGSLCLVELMKNAPWAAMASAAVCGACLGFLRWNAPPARIFLGDAGALLLGFWLAAIAVAAAAKTAAATTLALPLLVMGVPVLDTLWAVVRRAVNRQPLWRGDRGHLHHRLLARGFSPQKTVLLIYALSAALGAVAVLWTSLRG